MPRIDYGKYINSEVLAAILALFFIQSEGFAKQISNSKRAKRQLINYLLFSFSFEYIIKFFFKFFVFV